MPKELRTAVCIVCGKTFETTAWNRTLCSTECRRKRARRAHKDYMKTLDKNDVKLDRRCKNVHEFHNTMGDLTSDAVEAKRKGMTYGQYMAWKRGF